MSQAYISPSFALAVAPSDVTVLTPTQRLWIGTTGNLSVRMFKEQNVVAFNNVPVGWFELQVDQVLATGTTASGIVAAW